MELLVAYRDDPAGHNMAKFLSKEMSQDGDIFHGKYYDLIVIPTPTISADWLEEKYDYDGFVFLSKHAADSGVLALTCHSTGNFSDANITLLVEIPDKLQFLNLIFKNYTFKL